MPGTETKMQFTISIVLDNVDSAAVDDDASDKAIRLTLQDALIELSLSDISILSMTEFSSGFSAVELVVYSFTVNYLVEVVLEQLGYTASDGAELYSNWVAAVDVSVSSGDFSTNLSNNAEATNAVPLYDATANSAQEVEYGEYSLTSISTSQKGSTHSVTLGTRIGYISFIACMVIASVYIVWSFIDGRKKFMLKFPPKATRISGKHDASVDDFSVTVNRTTFSKRISTSSETLAHVSNPMRKVPEESSSDNSL